jgi:regulatory protein
MKGSSRRKDRINHKLKNSSSSPFNYALMLLSRRDYSEFEIREKLKKRYSKEEIEDTIKKLVERRLLSDERYVKRIIEKYAFIKKYGYLKVQYELLHRGIEREIFASLLDELYPEYKEKENAISISARRPIDKLRGYLASRGYRTSIIREVLAELKDE